MKRKYFKIVENEYFRKNGNQIKNIFYNSNLKSLRQNDIFNELKEYNSKVIILYFGKYFLRMRKKNIYF